MNKPIEENYFSKADLEKLVESCTGKSFNDYFQRCSNIHSNEIEKMMAFKINTLERRMMDLESQLEQTNTRIQVRNMFRNEL